MIDICLLLEGTFPYVAGGVSTWVYNLIRAMEDINFSVVYVGPHYKSDRRVHYEIPSNVVDFREVYIFDYGIRDTRRRQVIPRQDLKSIADFLANMKKNNDSMFDELVRAIGEMKKKSINLHDLVYSYEVWEILLKLYSGEQKEASFIDYFWTWRFIYLPFFALLNLDLPKARVYHSLSTGYAGLLGAMAKAQFARPFLLTEHGIYTRERKIDIAQADWIYSESAQEVKVTEDKDFFKDWWMSLFVFFSRLSYAKADQIITLFEGNRKVQIEEGAPAEKTRIIPNGIRTESFTGLARKAPDGVFRIGFMGRVVPIKDVKTFIRAVKIIHNELKNIEVYIMGPTDEDEVYFQECVLLTERESLKDVIRFTGKINTAEYYPKLDIIVLTSISEGQPIVILEAGASGIPVVATQAGACEELLYGNSPDDRLLGRSGLITALCDPEATARAVLELLRNPQLYSAMSQTGCKRVNMYYHEDLMLSNYRQLYFKYLQEFEWQE